MAICQVWLVKMVITERSPKKLVEIARATFFTGVKALKAAYDISCYVQQCLLRNIILLYSESYYSLTIYVYFVMILTVTVFDYKTTYHTMINCP